MKSCGGPLRAGGVLHSLHFLQTGPTGTSDGRTRPRRDSASELLSPSESQQLTSVVGLIFPAVSFRGEYGRIRTAKERRPINDCLKLKHLVASEEFEKVVDAADLEVVNH